MNLQSVLVVICLFIDFSFLLFVFAAIMITVNKVYQKGTLGISVMRTNVTDRQPFPRRHWSTVRQFLPVVKMQN